MPPWVKRFLAPAFSLVTLGGFWCLLHIVVAPYRRALIPYPWDVFQHGFTEHGVPSNPRQIVVALGITAGTAVASLAISGVAGFVVAAIMLQSKTVERALMPSIIVLKATPIIALLPLIYIFTGSGYASRVLICVLISIFPVIVNVLSGLKSPTKDMHDLFSIHDASRLQRLIYLQLPASIGSLMESLKISSGLCVIGSLVAEFYLRAGPIGLGTLISSYSDNGLYEQLFAAVIVTVTFGLVLFGVIAYVDAKREAK